MEQRVLAGRYQLIAKLGEGGMGSVWRAQHLALGTPLAVKLIDPSMTDSAEAVARFKREAQSAAALRSVHVVQIIDYGVDDGIPFIAMELLEGETLAARLERVYRLSPICTASIVTQVARALARAHAAGIVHRDLKPANIFLSPEVDDDVTKVLDFGIAKHLEPLTESAGVKTRAGVILGSPYYMSPEQALGQTTIDHRTDIWSLGVIACQCLSGQRPFDKNTPGALLMAICSEPIPKPSSLAAVPAGFDEWFARATARCPTERFESAAEAAAELREICGAIRCSQRNSLPSLRSDTTISSRGESVAASTAAISSTPSAVGQMTVSSSMPIRGQGNHKIRNALLAVVGLISLTALGLLAARGVDQGRPIAESTRTATASSQGGLAPTPVTTTVPAAAIRSPTEPSPITALVLPSASASVNLPWPVPTTTEKPRSSRVPTTAKSTKRTKTPLPNANARSSAKPVGSSALPVRDMGLAREVGF